MGEELGLRQGMLPNGGAEGPVGSDDDDWDDYEEDNPITDDQKAFAKEFLGFFQSLIDREEESLADVDEEFVSEKSLDVHFAKHCVGNSGRKSTKRDILYDFTTKKQYSNYEGRLQKSFREGPVDSLNSIFDVDDINEKFRRFFEGDKYILIGAIFGLENNKGPVSLGIHSFSSDVTTNYNGGNTVDICVMNPSLRTITLYALDVQLLKSKLLSIFKRYLKKGTFKPSQYAGKLLDGLGKRHPMPFEEFLDKAEVILVNDAKSFDINEWETENEDEIREETGEGEGDAANPKPFVKYRLSDDKIRQVVDKIIHSNFSIINYWKTNQFKKRHGLTDDDLKDILKTLTADDYKANSKSVDNSRGEAVVFLKDAKGISDAKLYIKLDYDTIESNPVIVISFHDAKGRRKEEFMREREVTESKLSKDDKAIVNSVKSNGVYSLKKGWLKHPERKDIPDVDMDAFDKLFAGWKARYDGLAGKAVSSDDVTEFIEDLYCLRRKSIAEDGEYGLGNLVFKEFRNRGYLDRLRELRNELKSRELSLEGLHSAAKQG